MSAEMLRTIAGDLRYPDLSGLYAAVGEGRISAQSVVSKVVRAVSGAAGAQEDLAELTPIPPKISRAPKPSTATDSGIEVEGAADVLQNDLRVREAYLGGV